MKIISSLGSKGGTGKSTITFGITLLMIEMKKNILVINCDNSSVSMPFLLSHSKVDHKVQLINIDDYYLTSFIRQNNTNFLNRFDYIVIDLKGEELRDEDMANMFDLADMFIMPFIPSISGIAASYSTIDKAKSLGCDTSKINVLINLIGYNEKSTQYNAIKEQVKEHSDKYGANFIEQPIFCITNLEDKDVKKANILNNKNNKEVINEILDRLNSM